MAVTHARNSAVHIVIPHPAVVLLIGTSGAGKTTFARKHFKPTEVVSSDHCRTLIADDVNDMNVTPAAFELVQLITRRRLEAGRRAVIDATNLKPIRRRPYVRLAQRFGCPSIAIVFNLPHALCLRRNQRRLDHTVPASKMDMQRAEFERWRSHLAHEGLTTIYEFIFASQVRDAIIHLD
jgi:protein phosphatase